MGKAKSIHGSNCARISLAIREAKMTTQFILGFAAGCVAGPIILAVPLLLIAWLFFDNTGI